MCAHLDGHLRRSHACGRPPPCSARSRCAGAAAPLFLEGTAGRRRQVAAGGPAAGERQPRDPAAAAAGQPEQPHRRAGAEITVAALPCQEKEASAFGLMKINNTGRIIEFAEKPSGEALKAMQVRFGQRQARTA